MDKADGQTASKQKKFFRVANDTQGTLFVTDEEALHRQVWGQPHLQSKVHDYVCQHSIVPQAVQDLMDETMNNPYSIMATTIDQLPLLAMFIKMINAKCVVELGTFTGISALQFALAVPDDGKVITIDISDEHLGLAKQYWEKAKVSHKIESRLGTAMEVLNALGEEGYDGKIDFAFIDADKLGYDSYYEKLLSMMRQGGVIVMDNVLQSSKVADETFTDAITNSFRDLNKKLLNDKRIDFTLIPVADGLAVCRFKGA